jgi:CBS domain-containing protein
MLAYQRCVEPRIARLQALHEIGTARPGADAFGIDSFREATLMHVSDAMTPTVITAKPSMSIDEIVRLMVENRISGLPVIDEHGKLVGIVTEGDLLRRAEMGTELSVSRWRALLMGPARLAEQYTRAHARTVQDLMTREVATIAPTAPLAEVVALMQARAIKRLPVVDQGRLVGIISRADLMKALERLLPKASAATLEDADIQQRIFTALERQRWKPHTYIDIGVKDGIVDVSGVILDQQVRDALRVLIEGTPGVKRVVDRLVYVEPYMFSPP